MIIIETANSGTGMSASDWVTLAAALLAFVASIVAAIFSRKSSRKSNQVAIEVGELSMVSQDKQRLIETISAQRIEWINKIRQEFVEFNKLAHTMSMICFAKGQQEEGYNFAKDYQELIGLKNHIYLLLNPTELYSKKINSALERIIDIIASSPFDMDSYRENVNELSYVQQVILKSEWKRIKVETESGEQISDNEMKEMFRQVGNEISKLKYDKVFNKRLRDNMILYDIVQQNADLSVSEIKEKLNKEFGIDMTITRIAKVRGNIIKNLNIDELENS